jgi:hypothetical protein
MISSEPHLDDLRHEGQPVEFDRFMAPVELIGLAGIEAQRNEGLPSNRLSAPAGRAEQFTRMFS